MPWHFPQHLQVNASVKECHQCWFHLFIFLPSSSRQPSSWQPSQNIRQDLGCLFIWGLLCLEVSWQFQPSHPRSARQKEKDSAFEMRHPGSSPLMQGRARCEQAMCYTLSDPHLGLTLVLKVIPYGNGGHGELLIHLTGHIPHHLHLQAVVGLNIPLEHCGPSPPGRTCPSPVHMATSTA